MQFHDDDIPPEVPVSLAELDRAIMLLGALSQGVALRPSRQYVLRSLLGACPAPGAQAASWKKALKDLRPELLELDAAPRRRIVS